MYRKSPTRLLLPDGARQLNRCTGPAGATLTTNSHRRSVDLRRQGAGVTLVALLLMVLPALASCGGNTPAATGDSVRARADRDAVTLLREAREESLPAPDETLLEEGAGINVNDVGRALLTFSDLLTVEVLRDGELVIQQVAIDEQNAVVTVLQNGGTLVNDFDTEEEIERRFTINGDFAVIEATGTRFIVSYERDSPLQWVVALEAEGNDLAVTAGGTRQWVPTGMARWIAPGTPPSGAIAYDQQGVDAWVDSLREGRAQPDIGDALMEQANIVEDTGSLEELPGAGESFELGGVFFQLVRDGQYGNARYALQDCNGDGEDDIAVAGGRIVMDFTAMPRRVRVIDVTVLYARENSRGVLQGLDPAREVISRSTGPSARQRIGLLSVHSDAPYHYATIDLNAGCFLGFSLSPAPGPGEQHHPRPSIRLDQGDR